MSGKRIHSLAKEINIESKKILDSLKELGIEAKSHMSSISEDDEKRLMDFLKKSEEKPKAAKKPASKTSVKKTVSKKAPEKKEDKAPEKKDKKTAPKKESAKKETKQVKETPSEKKKPEAPLKQVKKETEKSSVKSTEVKKKSKPAKKTLEKKPEPGDLGIIKISSHTSVRQFAAKIKKKTKEVMMKFSEHGINVGASQNVEFDLLEEIAGKFGYLVEKLEYEHEYLAELNRPDNPEDLVNRVPVVTFMGHVDHGKTSLLDKIRHSRITSREAGGITQHIGAYQIEIPHGKITFLDTPGHEAFTLMRARGADVTDIVILVVAADEGLKPQTIEAINHAKAAGVAIIVAINKMDKPEANPDNVKRQLLEKELVVEDYGGDIIAVNVSAHSGEGIEELLEYINLVAEMLEIKAKPDKPAIGSIIEAKVDKGRGPVATVLIQNGTLKKGDIFTCGTVSGKVRAMFSDLGNMINEAPPSTPVEILGFSEIPQAGDKFYAVPTDQIAREIASMVKIKESEDSYVSPVKKLSLEDLFQSVEDGKVKEFPVVLKCDVQGSLETIEAMLNKLSNDQVKIMVIHKAVGAVSENDVLLAAASGALIVGFHVKADKKTIKLAEREGIEIRIHNIIYEITNEMRNAMEGLLDPEIKEERIGKLQIRQIFKVPKVGIIAGCYVLEGYITRKSFVRVYRDNILIHEGKLSSLKRFKDDAAEVKQGFECGVGFESLKDLREGDEIEVYIEKEVAGKLNQ